MSGASAGGRRWNDLVVWEKKKSCYNSSKNARPEYGRVDLVLFQGGKDAGWSSKASEKAFLLGAKNFGQISTWRRIKDRKYLARP